ncbi:hypothetical protein [Microtetraspora sp. NBRC 16547]|uniref:hypothetical protein n=1 Tax=Microtetraspora sp. NBRC 16547 TaxID=3030993 RepID=UPI0024A5F3FF|nr:hypothetical protein [Microtetraspora sp. NBRC 16547]GLX01846.1 hypothetical protein Misp02_59320 [Microtetraspora sp. NBRC 16547]
MKPDRRMLVSAGVVTAIVVGGVSVATTASAGRLEQATKEQAKEQVKDSTAKAKPSPSRSAAAPADERTILPEMLEDIAPYVVENPFSDDPGTTRDYWTIERLQGAEPMPMPQVSISIITPSE